MGTRVVNQIKTKCIDILKDVDDFIPFHYRAKTLEKLGIQPEAENYKKVGIKIQKVRRGAIHDMRIARAIREVALDYKKETEL